MKKILLIGLLFSSLYAQNVFQLDNSLKADSIKIDEEILFKKDENGLTQYPDEPEHPSVSNFIKNISSKNYSEIENNLKNGNPVDSIYADNNTPLIMSAMWGDKKLLDLLLKYKANVKATNSKGESALHWACSTDNLENLRSLLYQKAIKNSIEEINKKTKSSRTCLHFAALYSQTNINDINFILSLKGDVRIKDSNGQTPAHIAASLGRWDILLQLLKTNQVAVQEHDVYDYSVEDYIMTKSDVASRILMYDYLSETSQNNIKRMLVNNPIFQIKS